MVCLFVKLINSPIKKIDPIENINEPKTPDKVLFGLILDIFFHLKILPNV